MPNMCHGSEHVSFSLDKLGHVFFYSKWRRLRIIIEGDATNVTDAVLGDHRDIPWSINSVVRQIKDIARKFNDVEFVSVPKCANNLAHSLCQYAMHNNVNNWWDENSPPSCILSNLTNWGSLINWAPWSPFPLQK